MLKPRKAKSILDAMAKRTFDENRDVFELATAGGTMLIQFIGNDLVVTPVAPEAMYVALDEEVR